MRKPSQTEPPIQSRDTEENPTGNPPRKLAERPTLTMKWKCNHIIPHLLVVCMIMVPEYSAHALTFNLTTNDGTGTGTLTTVATGTTDSSTGLTEYEVTDISGTFDSQTITGIGVIYQPSNLIEIASNGTIQVDGIGLEFATASSGDYLIYNDTTPSDASFAPADLVYNAGPGNEAVTSFTSTAPTTPVPFQAPLADAIPVIGSVLVLGALRKVRNFKKA